MKTYMVKEADRVWVVDTVKGADKIWRRHAKGTFMGVFTHRVDTERKEQVCFIFTPKSNNNSVISANNSIKISSASTAR